MSDIQILLNSVQELNAQFAESIKTLNESVALLLQEIESEKEINVEEKALKFVDFFSEELGKSVPCGKYFAGRLNYIRQNYDTYCYQSLASVYHDLIDKPNPGWAQRRQTLITASAIWRYTFHGRSYDLKCQIEAALECSDCGQFVRPMVERMVQEKLWV